MPGLPKPATEHTRTNDPPEAASYARTSNCVTGEPPSDTGATHDEGDVPHEPVMVAAKEEQVVELRFAAVGPVPDVVRVGEPEPAAREPAAPVPRVERPSDRGRHGALLAAHVEHGSIDVVPEHDQ